MQFGIQFCQWAVKTGGGTCIKCGRVAAWCSLRIWQKKVADWINYRCHAVYENPLKSHSSKKWLVELLMGRGDGELFTDISHLMDCTIKNNFPLSVFTPPYIFRFRTVVVWNPNFKPLWNYFLPFLNNTKRVLTVKGVNRSIECRGFGGCSSPGITTRQNVQYISKAVTF